MNQTASVDRGRAWTQGSLWAPADWLRVLVVAAVGLALCVGGWWSVAQQDAWADQVTASSIGVAGFALVAYAEVSWMLRARFRLLERRAALLPDLGDALDGPASGSTSRLLVAGPGLGRYHRSDCPFVIGKRWSPVPLTEARAGGRQPCGVCEP